METERQTDGDASLAGRLEAVAARCEERLLRAAEAIEAKLATLTASPARAAGNHASENDEIVELLESNEALEARLAEIQVRCAHLEGALRKAEADLRRHKPSEALETQLEELSARCRELEAGKAAVEAAMGRHAGTLVSVARELRLPLQGMLGLLSPLHEARKLDERQIMGLTAAEASGRMLLSLLDCFEDLAAIEDDRLDLDNSIFDLHETVQGVAATLGPVAASLGLQVNVSIDSSVPHRVSGDPRRLHRLLLHLCSQAVGFSLEGALGIHAAIESAAGKRTVVRFSVHSDGAGVPVERLRELLDPLAAAAGAAPGGEGGREGREAVEVRLGMIIYRKLTEVMGGRLGVQSVPGGGFAIWFSLALDQPGAVASERGSGRRLQEMLVCNLGPIIDLSMSGVRVLCSKTPRQKADLTIMEGGRKLRLKATLVWARRIGDKSVEAGLRFVDPTNQQIELLHQISLQHALRRQGQAAPAMSLPPAEAPVKA